MSKGGGGGGRQTQQSSSPDSEYMRMRGEIYGKAMDTFEGGQRYEGQTQAGFTSDQLQARNRIRGNLGMGQGTYADAMGRARSGMGFSADQMAPAQVGGAEIANYMSPYQQQVIDQTVSAQQDFLKGALEGEASRAAGSGALDSSRYDLMRGQTIRDVAADTGRQVAALQQQGYGQALSAAQADASRMDAASQFNIGNQFQQEQMQRQAANQMAQLQGVAKADFMNDSNAQMQLGNIEQAMTQAGLDFDREEFMRLEPESRLQMLYPLLGAGAGQSSSTSGGGGVSSRNRNMGALGMAATGAGTGFAIGGPPGAAIGGAIGLIGGYYA